MLTLHHQSQVNSVSATNLIRPLHSEYYVMVPVRTTSVVRTSCLIREAVRDLQLSERAGARITRSGMKTGSDNPGPCSTGK